MYKMILLQFEKERMEKEGDDYVGNVHSTEPLHYSDEPLINVVKHVASDD